MIQTKTTAVTQIWTENLRIRVGQSVKHNGITYTSVTGVNVEPGTTTDFEAVNDGVPYTGAELDVDLGQKQIKAKDFQFTDTVGGATSEILSSVGSSPRYIIEVDGYLYTANSQSDNISKVNISTGATSILASVGNVPISIVEVDGYLYTANRNSHNISKVNISTGATSILASVGFSPVSIVEIDGYLYVANSSSDNISKVNISTGATSILASVGEFPYSIVEVDGYLYTANSQSDNISKVNISTGASEILASVGEFPYSIVEVDGYLYTANSQSDNISKVNISTGATSILASVGGFPRGIIEIDGYLYVANSNSDNISKVNISTGATSILASVGVSPASITEIDGYLYVANSGSDNISKVSTFLEFNTIDKDGFIVKSGYTSRDFNFDESKDRTFTGDVEFTKPVKGVDAVSDDEFVTKGQIYDETQKNTKEFLEDVGLYKEVSIDSEGTADLILKPDNTTIAGVSTHRVLLDVDVSKYSKLKFKSYKAGAGAANIVANTEGGDHDAIVLGVAAGNNYLEGEVDLSKYSTVSLFWQTDKDETYFKFIPISEYAENTIEDVSEKLVRSIDIKTEGEVRSILSNTNTVISASVDTQRTITDIDATKYLSLTYNVYRFGGGFANIIAVRSNGSYDVILIGGSDNNYKSGTVDLTPYETINISWNTDKDLNSFDFLVKTNEGEFFKDGLNSSEKVFQEINVATQGTSSKILKSDNTLEDGASTHRSLLNYDITGASKIAFDIYKAGSTSYANVIAVKPDNSFDVVVLGGANFREDTKGEFNLDGYNRISLFWTTDTENSFTLYSEQNEIYSDSVVKDVELYNDNTLYSLSTDNSEDVELNDWETSSNGYFQNIATFNSSAKLIVRNQIALRNRRHETVFSIATGGSFFFGFQKYNESDLVSTLLKIDFSNDLFTIYENGDLGTVFETETIATESSYADNKYKLVYEVIERGCKVEIISELSGLSIMTYEFESELHPNNEIGLALDYQFCYSTGAKAKVYSLECFASVDKLGVYSMFLGDSITAGLPPSAGSAIVPPLNDWATKVGEASGLPYCVSGRPACTIAQLFNRLDTEVSKILPQNLVILIGRNGGNYLYNLRLLVNSVRDLGINPILSTVPLADSETGLIKMNSDIIDIATELGVKLVRMDIALALNNDLSDGRNTSMYVDGVHPDYVNAPPAIVARFKYDTPELFN